MGKRIFAMVGVLLLIIVAGSVATPARAQTTERCFSETGYCISGRLREFWEQNGGLTIFGYPLGPQRQAQIEGRTLTIQEFQRFRLELHPENLRPYDVLLGRMGADRLAQLGRDWFFAYPATQQQAGCRYVPETRHNICGAILALWSNNGLEIDGRAGKTAAESTALFGLPLSDLTSERLNDGRTYEVQWFERARIELHPENQPPFNILLGLLGTEVRDNGGTGGPPIVPPGAPATTTPTHTVTPAITTTPTRAPTDNSLTVAPSRGARGTVFRISVGRFTRGEQVTVSFLDPSGVQYGVRYNVEADANGRVDTLTFDTTTVPDNPTYYGSWAAVAQGANSGIRLLGRFELTR